MPDDPYSCDDTPEGRINAERLAHAIVYGPRANAETIADALLGRFYIGQRTGQFTVEDAHRDDLIEAILGVLRA